MLKILIIEDDAIFQAKLQLMVEDLGYVPLVAFGIVEIPHLLATQSPDVILSDVKLPDGSAIDYFLQNPPQCPIIFITAVPDATWIEEVLSIRWAAFYVKPVHSLTLLAAIESVHRSYLNDPIHPKNQKSLPIPVRYGQTTEVFFSDIRWVEVEGNYITLFSKDRKYVQRLSFRKLIPLLDARFIQIHHSIIVNKDYLTRINLNENTVYIHDKAFGIGRTFRKKFIELVYQN